MLIDLFAPSNYISYNIQVAEVLGLKTAIYISEIANINSKAIRKEKIDEDNFFTLDREYLTKRTTLTAKEQEEIETKLLEISVLEKCKTDPNMLYLNINNLVAILTNGDDKIIEDVKKLVKGKPKKNASEGMKIMAQNNIKTTCPELRTAWYDWIDSVILAKGKITKAAVTQAEKDVDTFANHNLEIALEVVNWTAIKGYNEMRFGIDHYKEMHPEVTKALTPQTALPRNVSIGNEVF